MLWKKGLLFALLALLIVPFASLSAQDQPTISIALPGYMRSIFDENIFDDFESAMGVQVYVRYVDSDVPPAPDDVNAYLDAVGKFAASADVLLFPQNQLNPLMTRAGYLLDLAPLTSADPALNPDDFIPAGWNSVQWDGGVWGLPLSVDATMLVYDPAAFDKAGLAYPNERWTLDDLANAARALTQYDANGKVSVPGLSAFGSTADLFRSLYGQNFYDDSGTPRFADPALEALLTQWQALLDEGIVGSTFVGGSGQIPMSIIGSFGLGFPQDANQSPLAASALPGGRVGLSVTSVAVSAGTLQPELAYALAKYLTHEPSLANGPFGGIASRLSLAGVQAQPSETSTGVVTFFAGGASPAVGQALDQLLPSALTLLEQGYGNYVAGALGTMSQDKIDAHSALQQAEAQASSDVQAAADRRASVSVVVATPPPPVVLQPGEIALKFGIQSFIQPIPNIDEWQQLATDFAASDTQVGAIDLDTSFGGANEFAQHDDCFYLTSNAVPNLDATKILNLDPYLDADPNFDPNDVLGGVLAQLQKDDHTWAYPLTIQPQTLRYSADIFQQAGVPAPENGWTIDQFNDALRALKDYLDKTPFTPHDLNGEALMMLIVAYGGLPVDYRTSPPTLNFSDPAAVDAIRQVLDLAKNGYIDYQTLAPEGSGGGFRVISFNAGDQDAITSDVFGEFKRIIGGSDPYRLVSYPSGTYTGASYEIGAGYISATAQSADACYHWLSYVAQRASIFGTMPARQSQIDAPNFQSSAGANAGFYEQYARLLQNPDTIVFPSAGGNSQVGDFITQYWLHRAFDHYVQDNADLAAELADAQTYAMAFQACVAALPPSDTSSDTSGFNSGVTDCASKVDPTVSDLFAGAVPAQ